MINRRRDVINALAVFQTRAFGSDTSPFDAVLKGQYTALNDQERAGVALFFGEAGCVTCHSGTLLSDHDFHAIAVRQIREALRLGPPHRP